MISSASNLSIQISRLSPWSPQSKILYYGIKLCEQFYLFSISIPLLSVWVKTIWNSLKMNNVGVFTRTSNTSGGAFSTCSYSIFIPSSPPVRVPVWTSLSPCDWWWSPAAHSTSSGQWFPLMAPPGKDSGGNGTRSKKEKEEEKEEGGEGER